MPLVVRGSCAPAAEPCCPEGADAHVDTGGVVASLHRLGSVGEEAKRAVAQGGCEGRWAQAHNGSRNGASKQVRSEQQGHEAEGTWQRPTVGAGLEAKLTTPRGQLKQEADTKHRTKTLTGDESADPLVSSMER